MIDALSFTLGAVIVLMNIMMVEVRNEAVGSMWFDVEVNFPTTIDVDRDYKPTGVFESGLVFSAGLEQLLESEMILLCRARQSYEQCRQDTINADEGFVFAPAFEEAYLGVNNPKDQHTVRFLPTEAPTEGPGEGMTLCVLTAAMDEVPRCFLVDLSLPLELSIQPDGGVSINQGVEMAEAAGF